MSRPPDVSLIHAVERQLPAGFTIQEQLGTGATSWVYLASRPGADSGGGASPGGATAEAPIVVKLMQPGAGKGEGAGRFRREMKILEKLDHPRIVPMLTPGEADGALFFTMPYVSGGTLRDRLNARGPLPIDEALAIAYDLAEALGHAHARGVVHRDVKPENILIGTDGAYLVDFGFASAPSLVDAEDAAREARQVVGTPDYVSPEEVTGKQAGDWRSDFYSLGCVLFEMLVGRSPFAGASARATIQRRLAASAPDVRLARPGVPEDVAAIVRKCLERSPNDRYATSGFLTGALRAALSRYRGDVVEETGR
jgi:serine/threonine-protein kinase